MLPVPLVAGWPGPAETTREPLDDRLPGLLVDDGLHLEPLGQRPSRPGSRAPPPTTCSGRETTSRAMFEGTLSRRPCSAPVASTTSRSGSSRYSAVPTVALD